MMKTLLQINVTANSGSTGKIAEQIGNIAMADGWRSVIAHGRGKPVSTSELYRIGTDLGAGWHLMQSRLFDRHGMASRKATRELIRFIEGLAPDVIHLHNVHGYFLNYKMLFEYLKKSDIPVVWTLHDCWSFTGHCAYFDFVSCEKWKTGCGSCPQLETYPQSFCKDNSKANFRLKKSVFTSLERLHLVPVSNWLSGILSDSFMSGYPKTTIHNGIDVNVFKPHANPESVKMKYGLEGKKTVIGVANIWEKRKGLQDFIALRGRLPEGYAILLVGLDSRQLEQLPEGIIGLERTESVDELIALYSLADVFFNPTYEDNFPTVNIESMACGTPVVTYDTGGCAEAVDVTSGAVVAKGDLESALINIQRIIADGKDTYAGSCRRRVLENFSKNERYKDYMNLYDNIIKQL